MKFPVKKSSWSWIILILLILLLPFILHGIWLLKPAVPLDLLLIDKTVSDQEKNEHASFTWLMNNIKVTKTVNKTLYTLDDYYGFFPQDSEKFTISDFEKLDTNELSNLSEKNQAIYITDSYGVYSNEWYQHQQISERSNLIYGGLTDKELYVIEQMKKQQKLILAEFNCIGSPTSKNIRKKFEELFRVHWTGWVGRYFDNLDPENTDIPRWLISNYKKQHQGKWPFPVREWHLSMRMIRLKYWRKEGTW